MNLYLTVPPFPATEIVPANWNVNGHLPVYSAGPALSTGLVTLNTPTLVRSHTRAVLSSLPVTTDFESLLICTLVIGLMCPRNTATLSGRSALERICACHTRA